MTTRDDLSRLVRDANDGGLSYARIAARAIDADTGEPLTKSYVHSLAMKPPANPPSESTLKALAIGLGVPASVVQRAAAAQWLGYVATELAGYSDDARVILAHLGDMPDEEVQRVRRIVENWNP